MKKIFIGTAILAVLLALLFMTYKTEDTYAGTWKYGEPNEAVTDTTQMTAPGNSGAISVHGFRKITWYFKIVNINTSVTVALQARKGTNGWWASVDQDSIVYTANNVDGLTWVNIGTADSLRFKWISEAGGTAAVITQYVGMSKGE